MNAGCKIGRKEHVSAKQCTDDVEFLMDRVDSFEIAVRADQPDILSEVLDAVGKSNSAAAAVTNPLAFAAKSGFDQFHQELHGQIQQGRVIGSFVGESIGEVVGSLAGGAVGTSGGAALGGTAGLAIGMVGGAAPGLVLADLLAPVCPACAATSAVAGLLATSLTTAGGAGAGAYYGGLAGSKAGGVVGGAVGGFIGQELGGTAAGVLKLADGVLLKLGPGITLAIDYGLGNKNAKKALSYHIVVNTKIGNSNA